MGTLVTELKLSGLPPLGANCTVCKPGAQYGSCPPRGDLSAPNQDQMVTAHVSSSSRGEWWHWANPRHTKWGQRLGEAAAQGSLTLCMSGIMGGGEERMEHQSPGDQPAQVSSLLGSSRAFLLADSHEKGVCQDPWRRKITRHTHTKKKKKLKKQNRMKKFQIPTHPKDQYVPYLKPNVWNKGIIMGFWSDNYGLTAVCC